MEKSERCCFAGHSVICDRGIEEKIMEYAENSYKKLPGFIKPR